MTEPLYPLKEKRIVVTRAKNQAQSFMDKIRTRGGRPFLFPMIDIIPAHTSEQLKGIDGHIEQYDWLLLTSANSVRFFFEQNARDKQEPQHESLYKRLLAGGVSIVTVGHKTNKQLQKYGLSATFIPQRHTQEGLIQEWLPHVGRHEKILFPHGNLSRPALAQAMREKGLDVTAYVLYRTIKPNQTYPKLQTMLKSQQVDVVTFTSSSAMRHFDYWLREQELDFNQIKSSSLYLASIGPITTRTAMDLGYPVHIEARKQTVEGLIEAIEAYIIHREV
ncbi:uroporphyrinogen-III synthase [Caldalkalibacillus salinus]|uniref:uroporphyrinogen-III synthase n=1 Tax=Caldalkalibacillus salinus TaxID=2803787 RepID=UPI001924531C|nr:uroporphyrinogen-III synthase [Caldalkalibacillus salinus]